jgi:GNAT superfamily N-acetyltransferase
MLSKEWNKEDYLLSTDKRKLQLDVIHQFLSNSYWAKNIPLALVKKTVAGSLCFGLYYKQKQIGFARIITDSATFAYLADVFIVEEHRGKKLSSWMMEYIMSYDELKGLRRWMLATRDAHGLYKKFGFNALDEPDRIMQKKINNPYK